MGVLSRLDAFNIRDVPRADKVGLRLHHLETAFDYDAPRRRLALAYWSRAEARWIVERGGSRWDWSELHILGGILFGPSPWARALVLPVFGRLGSVEAAVSGLAAPGPDFGYFFEMEEVVEGRKTFWRAKRDPHLWAAVEAAYYSGASNGERQGS